MTEGTWDMMMSIALLLLGLIIGSFLNVAAIRLLKKESVAYPPSRCVHCNHRLKPLDLVPVFSYLFLGGKCRYCRGRVSMRYPIGELATGLLYASAYAVFGWDKELLAALLLISILVVITQTDLEQMIIPNRVVLFGVIAAIAVRIWSHPLPWRDYAAAAFAGSGFLLAAGLLFTWLLKREAMGGGDIKLYVFIGLILGLKLTMLSIFIASLFGAVIGTGIKLFRPKAPREIPFGPYIAAGSLVSYYYGNELISWYLGSF